jgi:ribonuclease P protein component
MQKELRLRKGQDFSLVYRLGKSWADNFLVLKALARDGEREHRFGFTVGKRTGNAVVRNTIKRRLRGIIRGTPVKNGWDVVLIARGRSRSANYDQLRASVRRLLMEAGLLAIGSD